MIPPLRIAPPSPAQLAADPRAPHIAWFGQDLDAVAFATAAVGVGATVEGGIARVVASRHDLARLADELAGRRAVGTASRLRRYLDPVPAWKLRTRELPLDRPHIMGILNLTGDSFSGDGVGRSLDSALKRAHALREAGAVIIDVGAETARADRPALDPDHEAAIVHPVVEALSREGHCISIDTYKTEVAAAGLAAGAEAVNDISGLTLGVGSAREAAKVGAAYVLNYSYSVPKRRPDSPPVYADVVAETIAWMFSHLARLRAAGLPDARIAIDPGIAFGKSHDEDLQVLRRLGEFTTLGLPILLAHSRKNFIGSISGRPPAERDPETHVVTALAFAQGARIFRVHDPEGAARALQLAAAIAASQPGDYAPDAESWPWRAGASAAHMTTAAPEKPAPPGQRW